MSSQVPPKLIPPSAGVFEGLALRIKLILRRHKYPPDLEQRAIELVLKQAEALGEEWVA